MQELRPVELWYLPLGHLVQEELVELLEYLPAWQLRHLEPSRYCPDEQEVGLGGG